MRPITFDPEAARGRDDVVLVHLNHRLVQMSLRLLRAEVWSDGGGRRLRRFTARLVPDDALEEPAMVALGRLVIVGGDGRRLHEEVIAAGGMLVANAFRRLPLGQLESALARATPQPATAAADRLKASWSRHRDSLEKALDARKSERAESLKQTLSAREAKEKSDIDAVLHELERAIRQQLDEYRKPQQQELFGEERDQRDRNRERLAARLHAIPAEIEEERRAIADRFRDPKAQLFPAAVVFLVPRRREVEAARSAP